MRAIRVEVERRPPGVLHVRYVGEGDIARLLIPAEGPPERADKLWQHTCFEAFLTVDRHAYCELNFSPSRQWAAYRFADYRQGMTAVEQMNPPRIAARREHDRFTLDATMDLTPLVGDEAVEVRIALCAVIEDLDGAISYWALAHPPGTPDFHHAAGFAMTLSGALVERRAAPGGDRSEA